MKKIPFVNDEYYHIYNRGTDKRAIISDGYDLERFFQAMDEFNVLEPIGSIYENSFLDEKMKLKRKQEKLVEIVAYCVIFNHYHFILKQLVDDGISKFMQRFANGHTKYYNNKYQRNGVLFQGTFKAIHIDSNEYLLHLSAYINLNNKAHKLGSEMSKLSKSSKLGSEMSKLSKSSWREYVGESPENFCKKDVILDQFKNTKEYKEFAEDSLKDILERKERDKEFRKLLLD